MRPIILAAVLALGGAGAGAPQTAETDAAPADNGAVPDARDAADPMAPRDAAGLDLDEFLWRARPIIVFADTPADPRFVEQLELLAERPAPLLERDVIVLTDTDPAARSAVRARLRPRGFALVVMQKDGGVGIRRPSPRDVREIVRAIDKFSLRQEEVRRGE